ncbi:MAG TPA: cytochrome c maturation protein CcmE [Methanosarcinaceae archaeon]|nr:cytochrome c maturation protein CcmE [Methanosarcinaceae archaeon]
MDKKQKTIIAIGAIIAVAIIGLWDVDFSQEYIMVSELTSNPDKYVGESIGTMGTIKNGTLIVNPDIISFIITDAEDGLGEIHVEYTGDLPPTLDEGKDISMSGTMVAADKIEATQIVVGCSSKYTE